MKCIRNIILLTLLLVIGLPPGAARGQFFFLQNPSVGRPAPDFTLETVGGETYNLKEYIDGQKAIIFFWATWCPHCRAALEALNEKRQAILSNDIRLVVVDLGESRREVASYLERNGIDLEVFLDTESSLSEPYGIIGLPTFYFVDEGGVVQSVQHTLPEDYDNLFSSEN